MLSSTDSRRTAIEWVRDVRSISIKLSLYVVYAAGTGPAKSSQSPQFSEMRSAKVPCAIALLTVRGRKQSKRRVNVFIGMEKAGETSVLDCTMKIAVLYAAQARRLTNGCGSEIKTIEPRDFPRNSAPPLLFCQIGSTMY